MLAPDYLVIGHITRDLLPAGGEAPGGTARYAAAVAVRLGLRAAILTAGDPAALPPPAGAALAASPSPLLTTFANRYGPSGRRQWLHAVGAPVDLAALPAAWRAAPVVHLAPVAAELDLAAALDAFPRALIGVTPQGWMRAWAPPLPAEVRYAPWRPSPALLRRVGLVVLSVEDLAGDEAAAVAYAEYCPLVVVTRGAAGATLYLRGAPRDVAPFPAVERDPTGAGDVFACAMLARLHETGDPAGAAAFASAAAALSVAGPGLGALTGRAAVERLLG
ncbi:MAG TPA: PfkB family carbohydrate kinase [Chloroflexaceae bacterium]|nr:PfkB family carbohydrate kinase [Chloroflexaceae bacterium]